MADSFGFVPFSLLSALQQVSLRAASVRGENQGRLRDPWAGAALPPLSKMVCSRVEQLDDTLGMREGRRIPLLK